MDAPPVPSNLTAILAPKTSMTLRDPGKGFVSHAK